MLLHRVRGSIAVCLLPMTAWLGCKNEKSDVERRAEQIAASASAAAAASASAAAAPDPKEEKFKALTKALQDRATAHMVAMQKLYEKDTPEARAAVRGFFPVGDPGEPDAKQVIGDITFAGPQGMTIRRFEIGDATPSGTLDGGTTDITEEQATRGKPRCVQYTLRWQDQAGTLMRVERQRYRIVACTDAIKTP